MRGIRKLDVAREESGQGLSDAITTRHYFFICLFDVSQSFYLIIIILNIKKKTVLSFVLCCAMVVYSLPCSVAKCDRSTKYYFLQPVYVPTCMTLSS